MTAEQLKAGLNVMMTTAKAIEAAGRIPSGHLYAMLNGQIGLSLEGYESLIRNLVKTGLVKQEDFELVWVG